MCVCVKEQFIWMTKIPIWVDKGLTACIFKTMTTLTFYTLFCSRHKIIYITILIFWEMKAREVFLLNYFVQSILEKKNLIGSDHISSWRSSSCFVKTMQQTLFLTPGAIPHLLNDWWGWNEYSYLIWPNRHDLDWKFSSSEQQHAGDMFPAGFAGAVTSPSLSQGRLYCRSLQQQMRWASSPGVSLAWPHSMHQ